MVHNDAPAQGEERYSGHRVIKIWDYDVENDKVVPGTDRIIEMCIRDRLEAIRQLDDVSYDTGFEPSISDVELDGLDLER